MKNFHFLVGMPRAGNTLFSSILNQNKDILVTANSPVCDMIHNLHTLKFQPTFNNFPNEESIDNVIKNVFNNYYSNTEANNILDRSTWGIPDNLQYIIDYVTKDFKCVVLDRPVIEVIASFIKHANENPKNYINFRGDTIEKRADFLMDYNSMICREYLSVKSLKTDFKKHILLINYDELVSDTENIIKSVYEFLDIQPYDHHYNNLNQLEVNGVKYNDIEVLGSELHKIREDKIEKQNYKFEDILPKSVIEKYEKWK
jgi:sulfotransferase